ncbi:MAG: hypothetical protein QOF19_2599 [Alphaproteobacteria bacterium]|nr:hypothetical protein [Alphaproteobacteria bacterium]
MARVRGFRLIARLCQRALSLGAIGHVTSDALDFRIVVWSKIDGNLPPRDPAPAVGCGDLLIIDARPVGCGRGIALFQRRQGEIGADQRLAAAAGQRAEGVVGIGDDAAAVAAHDHVALRFEEIAGALLDVLKLPIAVGEFLRARLQAAALLAQRPVPLQQEGHGRVGHRDYGGDADGEQSWVDAGKSLHGSTRGTADGPRGEYEPGSFAKPFPSSNAAP